MNVHLCTWRDFLKKMLFKNVIKTGSKQNPLILKCLAEVVLAHSDRVLSLSGWFDCLFDQVVKPPHREPSQDF